MFIDSVAWYGCLDAYRTAAKSYFDEPVQYQAYGPYFEEQIRSPSLSKPPLMHGTASLQEVRVLLRHS